MRVEEQDPGAAERGTGPESRLVLIAFLVTVLLATIVAGTAIALV